VDVRFVDETEFCFGWIHPEPRFMQRTSHALVADDAVWLVDPTEADGVYERIDALGRPVAGVLQLLDRHARDSAAFAARYGVEVHVLPWGAAAGTPFEPLPVAHVLFGQEIALWCLQHRLLICGDSLGTAPYYTTGGERLAVHPLLRFSPPERLLSVEPLHILSGHGAGVHGDDTPQLLRKAVQTARRRAPRWIAGLPYRVVTGGR
jgi:hypothetical protein